MPREAHSPDVVARLPDRHDKAFLRHADSVTALPGAPELLAELTEMKVPWTIATSSRLETAHLAFELLGLSEDTPIVTWDRVKYANLGSTTFGTLPVSKRLAALPVLLQYAHVVMGDVLRRILPG